MPVPARLCSLFLVVVGVCGLRCPALAQPPSPPPTAAAADVTDAVDTADKDYSSELPRLPPLPLSQVIESFDVAEGFELQLVASEPLVSDPVAYAYDAELRLYVIEMKDYSEQETEHLGSVARLVDVDGDGRMDQRTTFVQGLSWPTAIWPWKDGVLVAEPPRITWYRDTDDDGISDQAEDWFVGFGRGNVQGLVNSFKWGVDGYLHGATSSSGAELQQPLQPDLATLALGRRDFAIDPLSRTLHAEAGGGQHGMCFNRWGDKFVTSNSDHLQQIIDLEWWLADHATSVPLPSTRRSIAVDGPQAEVYRASPVEPWRIVLTRLRISGVAPGVVEGGGRAAGYFTGATGTCIMDREAGFGDPAHDTAIVCDVGSNLVHRKRMIDEGLFWSGERIDQQSELLRSRDVWFRPVQIGDGPDGGLIIADMAREVIEHPKSLPPMIKKHLDLTSGRDLGRIWRLRPTSVAVPHDPPPAKLSSRELVANLAHPIAWQRRMASQLLIEREARESRSALEQAARQTESPEAQILAMHVLSRLQLLSADVAGSLLASQHPRVLQHAIRLIGRNELDVDLSQLALDERPRVQLELALAMASDVPSESQRQEVLGELLPRVQAPLVQAVVANLAGVEQWEIVQTELALLDSQERRSWLRLLLPVWANKLREDQSLQSWVLDQLLDSGDVGRDWRAALATSASRSQVAELRAQLPSPQQTTLDQRVKQDLERALATDAPRDGDFHVLRLAGNSLQLAFAGQMLQPTVREAAQQAVLGLLSWSDQPQFAELVIVRLSQLTPGLQVEALRGLASRTATAQQLATALEARQIQLGQIPVEVREQLRRQRDAELARRFEKLFGQVSSDRQAVIEQYSRGLESSSSDEDLAAGEAVFRQVCAQCHRLADVGNDVGPPLRQLGEKSPQQLLETILDPNREIDPKYTSYTLLDADDRVLTGIIQDESAGQIVLKSAGGEVHTLARQEISQLKNSGVSLMPVGLEGSISVDQMRQLIHYLKTVSSK